MAVFKSEKFPSLRVHGAGKFTKGSLEVDGEAAEKVRRIVGNPDFGVTEVEAEKPKPSAQTSKPADEKPADEK